MARSKSPEKRHATLPAAVRELAEAGFGAPTAKIARRAGLAAGMLFTYFANKEKLLNGVSLELKIEVYRRVDTNFPRKANLERRARHVWSSLLDWAIEFPDKRKVSAQLNVSDLITPETRMRAAAERGMIEVTLGELETRSALRGLPAGYASFGLGCHSDTMLDFIAEGAAAREQASATRYYMILRG